MPSKDDPSETVTKLTPCSPGAPGAIEKTWTDIGSDELLEPALTVADFEKAISVNRKTVTEADVAKHIAFTNEAGEFLCPPGESLMRVGRLCGVLWVQVVREVKARAVYWPGIGSRVVWHIGLMGIACIPWYLVSGALVCARARDDTVRTLAVPQGTAWMDSTVLSPRPARPDSRNTSACAAYDVDGRGMSRMQSGREWMRGLLGSARRTDSVYLSPRLRWASIASHHAHTTPHISATMARPGPHAPSPHAEILTTRSSAHSHPNDPSESDTSRSSPSSYVPTRIPPVPDKALTSLLSPARADVNVHRLPRDLFLPCHVLQRPWVPTPRGIQAAHPDLARRVRLDDRLLPYVSLARPVLSVMRRSARAGGVLFFH